MPGLLIGPKGETQREIEQRTGSTIFFRGKGSSKDGQDQDADDALHVLITASSDAILDGV